MEALHVAIARIRQMHGILTASRTIGRFVRGVAVLLSCRRGYPRTDVTRPAGTGAGEAARGASLPAPRMEAV